MGQDKKNIIRRLSIIRGHLEKVIEMAREERYCIDILYQSFAVQKALKEVDSLLLTGHLEKCVTKAFKEKRGEEATKELLKLFKKM